MPEYPLLFFPSPSIAPRARRGGGRPKLKKPLPSSQARRLDPQFQPLLRSLEQRQASLQDSPLGILPEQTLVLETFGSIDKFVRVIRGIEGLEWLGEIELEDIEPAFGFEDESNPEKALQGQLFFVMTNLQALQQVYRLFKKWERDQDAGFPDDLANLKKAFEHLKTIRFWGPEDRIRETGLLEDWNFRLEFVQERVPFEVELWFRNDPDRQLQAEAEVRGIVEELDGEIVQQSVIPEIAYHAVLGRIPRIHVQQIAEQLDGYKSIKLLHCEGIMHVRPAGQCAAPLPQPPSKNGTTRDSRDETPTGYPIVALLDGLPLTRHQELDGRLIVDDPDDYESKYQANERVHGTEMASLICLGDLDLEGDAVRRPLYVRPVMQPQHSDGRFDKEVIPEDELPVDLIHRAVRRLFVSEGGEPPAASNVSIINFSICSLDRPLVGSMSPLARLVDWLAWEFNVLFLVSAGNHSGELRLDVSRSEFREQDETMRSEAILKAIASDSRNRRLLLARGDDQRSNSWSSS